MFCPNCGTPIDGGSFCPNCGAPLPARPAPALSAAGGPQAVGEPQAAAVPCPEPVPAPPVAIEPRAAAAPCPEPVPAPPVVSDPRLPEGITQDENGAYHWTYRMHMLKNPTVLFTLLKVFGFIMLGLGALMSVMMLINDNAEAIPMLLLVCLAIGAGMCLLSAIVWLCMAAARGGWYLIEHTMDERKVVYVATQQERKKMRRWALVGFLVAMASDDLTMAGTSAALEASERFDSDYADVKSIQAVRRRDLIKVNNRLQRNTIYAAPHQYDFVYGYIVAHCPNAKVK